MKADRRKRALTINLEAEAELNINSPFKMLKTLINRVIPPVIYSVDLTTVKTTL